MFGTGRKPSERGEGKGNVRAEGGEEEKEEDLSKKSNLTFFHFLFLSRTLHAYIRLHACIDRCM